MQEIEYSRQVEKKKNILKLLSGKLLSGQLLPGVDGDKKVHFIRSPKIYGFRNKMEFSFEGKDLGLHRRGRFDEVVNLTECPVFSNWVGGFLKEVRAFAARHSLPYYRRRENKGLLRFLILRESKFTGENTAILVINSESFKYKKEWADTVKRYMPGKSSAVIAYKSTPGDSAFTTRSEIVGGTGKMKVKIGKLFLELSPYSFFQPNSYQVENIYSLINSKIDGAKNILDLYTGIGSISFYIAAACRRITGVENSVSCINDAKYNLQKIIPPGKIQFVAGKVRPFLAQCQKPYDCIILDPPRGGISYRVFKHIDRISQEAFNLAKINPVKIIYISCSIKNFKKDLEYISDNTEWKLKSLTGVDQFVHTPHLESVAEFVV
jgi:tRNA/tmRNA/rRNA uracil-C5-methylase (TrmA/RlmC/RlmD family)